METTYTQARANFAALCEHAASSLEPVVIHRRGAEDAAISDISADLRVLTDGQARNEAVHSGVV